MTNFETISNGDINKLSKRELEKKAMDLENEIKSFASYSAEKEANLDKVKLRLAELKDESPDMNFLVTKRNAEQVQYKYGISVENPTEGDKEILSKKRENLNYGDILRLKHIGVDLALIFLKGENGERVSSEDIINGNTSTYTVDFGKNKSAKRKLGLGDIISALVYKVSITSDGKTRTGFYHNDPRPGYYTKPFGKKVTKKDYLAIYDGYKLETLAVRNVEGKALNAENPLLDNSLKSFSEKDLDKIESIHTGRYKKERKKYLREYIYKNGSKSELIFESDDDAKIFKELTPLSYRGNINLKKVDGKVNVQFKSGKIGDVFVETNDMRNKEVYDKVLSYLKKRYRTSGKYRYLMNNPESIDAIVLEAKNFNVPLSLALAIVTQESIFNPGALSPVGAKGLMQLMPGTAGDMKVPSNYAIASNVQGGMKYLRKMLDNRNQDITLAVASYNAGPGNVNKYGGIPPFKETQNYVKRIHKYMNEYKKMGIS